MANLQKASALASHVLSALFESHDAAKKWRRSHDEADAKRFVAALYEAQDCGIELKVMMHDGGLSSEFAGPHLQPVTAITPPASSAHDAMMHLGAETGHVAFAVMKAAAPGHYKPGVEYQLPPLLAEPDMLAHVGVAVEAFLAAFADEAALNTLSAMLEQELARADKADTKPDTKKKSAKVRPLTTAARACAVKYRQARQQGDKIPMNQVVSDYVEAHGGSAESIVRTLRDHPHEWKKADTKRTR